MKICIPALASALVILCYNTSAQNTWIEKAYFDSLGSRGAVSFSIDNRGYIYTGANSNGGAKNDLWEYNSMNETWTQMADFAGESRLWAVGFAIMDYGYIGTGDGLNPLDDFWQYDPVSNAWTKKAKFPGGKRYWCTGFSIGDKGYIGNGYESKSKKDFWEYDPSTNSWTQIADLAGTGRSGSVGFSIGNKGYVCTGGLNNTGATDQLWEYDPSNGQWTEKASFPGIARAYAVGFVLNDKGYVGCGIDNESNTFSDFYAYDPVSDSWEEVSAFPGPARYWAVGFAINGKGYVGTGQQNSNDYLDDFWEYTPAGCSTPANLSATNISVASAKLKWDAAAGAIQYKVQYAVDSMSAPWTSKTINASKTAITIMGLAANKSYKWKVRSICGEEKSEYSAKQVFTTALRIGNEDVSTRVSVYPNPFRSVLSVAFDVDQPSMVTIDLLDVTGRKVKTVLDEKRETGNHELIVQKTNLPAGVYLLKLTMHGQITLLKVVAE